MYLIDNMMATRDSGFISSDMSFTSTTRLVHVSPISHGTMMTFYPDFFRRRCQSDDERAGHGEMAGSG